MRYPLIARCFPEIERHRIQLSKEPGMWVNDLIAITDIEAALKKAVRVGSNNSSAWGLIGPDYAYSALLLGIEPIVRDTAESLLREFERVFAASHIAGKRDNICINDKEKAWDLLDRANRLLGEK